MKFLFQKVAILGLGLIGGSIALDLKKKKLAKTVVGYNRSAAGRRVALRRKACDKVFSQPEKAVIDADLVILATPVRTLPLLAKKIGPFLKPDAIVTDVGSTKGRVVRTLTRILPKHVHFIGGHPVAGTEQSGMLAATENLFAGRWWILTRAFPRLKKFAEGLGAKVAVLSPSDHDQILAAISHLPHMVAYSLVDSVLHYKNGSPLRFAAGGFRDFTRVAASSPQMWTDICLDNAAALTAWIDRFQNSLLKLKKWIRRGDQRSLIRFFEKASQVRRKL